MDHSNHFNQIEATSTHRSRNLYHPSQSAYHSSQSLDSDAKLSYAESQFDSNSSNQPSEPDIPGTPSIGRSSYFTEHDDGDKKEELNQGFKSMISDSKKFKLDLSFNRIENLNDQQFCKSPKSLTSNQIRNHHQDLLLPPLPVSPLPSPSIKNDKPINSKELKKIYSTWKFPIRTDSPRGLTWGPFRDEGRMGCTRTRSQNQISRKIYVILKALDQNQTQVERLEKGMEVEDQSDSNSIQKEFPGIKTYLPEVQNSNQITKPEIIITSTTHHHPTLKSKKSKRTFELEIESQESDSMNNYKRTKPFHHQIQEDLNEKYGYSIPHYRLILEPIKIIQSNHQIIKNRELLDIQVNA